MIKKLLLGLLIGLGIFVSVTWVVGSAVFYQDPAPASPATLARPDVQPIARTSEQSSTKRVLFGDLHVHTSYSVDAALTDTPASKGTPYTTPTDACDFARYCSALDFWSINDHAEGLTPWQWENTREAIRQCDAVTDPEAPDMVSFLGWEWTHGPKDGNPETHWGHKNVMFRGTADMQVPTRPIASRDIFHGPSQLPAVIRGLAWLAMSQLDLEQYQSLAKHIQTLGEMEDCGDGDVRALPQDCFETAASPKALFSKLDEWGYDALVIPHGMAWGNTNPEGADFKFQMSQQNDKYQRLLEVYSGHGNSEVYRDLPISTLSESACPVPQSGYTACCWQAGEIIRNRCTANGLAQTECDSRAIATRAQYMELRTVESQASLARDIIPGTTPDEWGHCDQLVGTFQPAYYYQPKQSAQYMLALGDSGNQDDQGDQDNRFRPGFMGSSDNHTARPGNGYKEVERLYFTDAKEHLNTQPVLGKKPSLYDQTQAPGRFQLFLDSEDLSSAFYYTGGLVAVYSEGKTRDAIWDALYRREVYGTSGPRIGLQFEMLTADGSGYPMGSEVNTRETPRFKVRGMGSLIQRPGCPDYARQALGAQRLEDLCRNECYHPGNEAHAIERLEIVKVLPAINDAEKTTDLIEDPWRVVYCEAGATTCEAEFEDSHFLSDGREAAYYARVVQVPTPTIQGDPLKCELDNEGECKQTNICLNQGADDDCLSPASQRAWSSPLYVKPSL